MKKLQVNIDDSDFARYGFSESVEFDDLKNKILTSFAKEALKKCNTIAKEQGLSEMTLEEISLEIEASRNAKNRSGH